MTTNLVRNFKSARKKPPLFPLLTEFDNNNSKKQVSVPKNLSPVPKGGKVIYQQHEILKRFMAGELDRTGELEALWPTQPDTSHLLVACNPQDYSASAMAKAIEDCDAQLLGLSVTGMRDHDGRPVVSLTVSATTPEGAARSLERYGYDVIHTRSAVAGGPEHERNMERLGELLHYLEM